MLQPARAYSANLLIQAMVASDLALLKPYLERVHLLQGQKLAEAHQPISHVYFPEGGIISLTAPLSTNGQTEVGILGRDGMTGMAVLLGSDRAPHDTLVQLEAASALRINADAFRGVMMRCGSLQALLLRYAEAVFIQSMCSTASNAHHRMEVRLARWLLMCHDRVDGDEIPVTHAMLAMMIGAQRTGVTLCLHILEGGGSIASKRARVIIADRDKLEQYAADAYGVPEAEYRRLIGPFGRSANVLERAA